MRMGSRANPAGPAAGFPTKLMSCAQPSDCYRFRVTTIVIATRNAHKVGEIRPSLAARSKILTLNDFPDPPKVVEDADTFAGNATRKP